MRPGHLSAAVQLPTQLGAELAFAQTRAGKLEVLERFEQGARPFCGTCAGVENDQALAADETQPAAASRGLFECFDAHFDARPGEQAAEFVVERVAGHGRSMAYNRRGRDRSSALAIFPDEGSPERVPCPEP